MESVLLKIDLTGTDWSSSAFYVSSDNYIGENFYFPFLASAPKISIGGVEAGFLKVNIGGVTLVNSPQDTNHPFSGSRYTQLLSASQLIPFELRTSETTNPFFSGNLALVSVDKDFLKFQIFDEAASLATVNLLRKTLEESSVTVTDISSSGTAVIVTAAAHGLKNGQAVIFKDLMGIAQELIYSETTDNFYIVKNKTTNTFELNDRDGVEVAAADMNLLVDSTGSKTISADTELLSTFTVASGLTLTIANGVTVTVADTNTMLTGAPTGRPLAFGKITHKTPVIVRNTTNKKIINPFLDLSINNDSAPIAGEFLQLFEDGQEVGTMEDGDDKEFTTAATAELITADAAFTGQMSLSGVSTKGTGIIDYFTNVLIADLALAGSTLTLDKTKAPNSENLVPGFEIYAADLQSKLNTVADPSTSGDINITRDTIFDSPFTISSGDTVTIQSGSTLTITEQLDPAIAPAFINALSFYVTRQEALLDFSSRLARSINHQFYIKDDILYLIDRSNTPTASTTYLEHEIIEANYEITSPIRTLNSYWSVNSAKGAAIVAGSETAQGYPQLVSTDLKASIPDLGVGQDIDIENFIDGIPEMQSYLANILSIDKKPVVSVKVASIDSTTAMGDRIKFNRSVDYITADMIVRQIDYDFEDMSTVFIGEATLTQLEQGIVETITALPFLLGDATRGVLGKWYNILG
jgi:hypothetical protein